MRPNPLWSPSIPFAKKVKADHCASPTERDLLPYQDFGIRKLVLRSLKLFLRGKITRKARVAKGFERKILLKISISLAG